MKSKSKKKVEKRLKNPGVDGDLKAVEDNSQSINDPEQSNEGTIAGEGLVGDENSSQIASQNHSPSVSHQNIKKQPKNPEVDRDLKAVKDNSQSINDPELSNDGTIAGEGLGGDENSSQIASQNHSPSVSHQNTEKQPENPNCETQSADEVHEPDTLMSVDDSIHPPTDKDNEGRLDSKPENAESEYTKIEQKFEWLLSQYNGLLSHPEFRHSNCKLSNEELKNMSLKFTSRSLRHDFLSATYYRGEEPNEVLERMLPQDLEKSKLETLDLTEEPRPIGGRPTSEDDPASYCTYIRHPDCKHSVEELKRMAHKMLNPSVRRFFVYLTYCRGANPNQTMKELFSKDLSWQKFCDPKLPWEQVKRMSKELPNGALRHNFLHSAIRGKNPESLLKVMLAKSNVSQKNTKANVSSSVSHLASNVEGAIQSSSVRLEAASISAGSEVLPEDPPTAVKLSKKQRKKRARKFRSLEENQMKVYNSWREKGLDHQDALTKVLELKEPGRSNPSPGTISQVRTGLRQDPVPPPKSGLKRKDSNSAPTACKMSRSVAEPSADRHTAGTPWRPGQGASSCDTLRLYIVPSGYPRERLSDEQMGAVENSILEAIVEMNDGTIKPSFRRSSHSNGRYEVICGNDLSKNWLHEHVSHFKPWPNACLKILSHENTLETAASAVLPLCKNDDNDRILKYIANQNTGLNVDKWEVVRRWDDSQKTSMSLLIDPASAGVLKTCSSINFKIGTAKIFIEDPQTRPEVKRDLFQRSAPNEFLVTPQTQYRFAPPSYRGRPYRYGQYPSRETLSKYFPSLL